MKRLNNILMERKCNQCEKKFLYKEGWVFKRNSGARAIYFCSWSCLRAWEKAHKTRQERVDAVQVALCEGKSVEQVAEELNEDKTMVNYWYKRLRRENEVRKQKDSD